MGKTIMKKGSKVGMKKLQRKIMKKETTRAASPPPSKDQAKTNKDKQTHKVREIRITTSTNYKK
jgi:hypothetical protein